MNSRGFTFIEAMAVIAIIAILSVISFPFYQNIRINLIIDRAIVKLAQDIRVAQEMAMSSQEFGGSSPAGYGVYLSISNPNSYIIFADNNGNGYYNSSGDSIVKTVPIESGASIDRIYSSSTFNELCIVYFSPDPSVSLRYRIGGGWINVPGNSASVDLKIESKIKSAIINRAGLVDIN